MRPGTWQIVILVLVILLLFGARRLPDLARSVGQSLKIFKSEVKDLQQDESPRAVEARRDETSTHPATGHDSGAPATPAATEHRPADGDRGPTT